MSQPVATPEAVTAPDATVRNQSRNDASDALAASAYQLALQQNGPRASEYIHMNIRSGELNLPSLEIVGDTPNQQNARDAMKILTRPYESGSFLAGKFTNVLDAIDGHLLNGKHDGQIGKDDIDRFLNSTAPFINRTGGLSQQEKTSLQWLSNNWDSPEVKALRHGRPYLSQDDLAAYNRTPAGRPVQDPQDGRSADARPSQPQVGVRSQLREGTYSVDPNDPNRNDEADHTDLWSDGNSKIWADRGQGGRDIGYTYVDPVDGHYKGWKFNKEEEGGRWELYDGSTMLAKAKNVYLTEKGLSIDGKIFKPGERIVQGAV